jgi:hypothetical protein
MFLQNVCGLYQTTWLYITEDSTVQILEDSTLKDLFCMFTAGHTPEYHQGNQLMVCQDILKYNLKTRLWS